jgi:hypothetical protein
VLLVGVLAIVATSCSRDTAVPEKLMDGSPRSGPPVALQGVSEPAVLTKMRIVDVSGITPDSLAYDCLRGRASDARPQGRLVERIGVYGESVTFRDRAGLRGCDDSTGSRENDRRWCGGAFGQLRNGSLQDPRLDIVCTTREGKTVGFVWIEPAPETRYVVAEQPGFVEVYEVGGELPVRVATTRGVSVEGASVAFELSEHDSRGRRVRRYDLHAVVAG